jgi:ATP-binding cassette, subfamily B, bacterial
MNKTEPGRSLTVDILRLYVKTSLLSRRETILSLLNPIGAMLTNVGVPFFAGKALASTLRNDGQFRFHLVELIIVSFTGVLANRIGFTRLMALSAKTQSHLHSLAFRTILERGSSFHSNRISGKLVSDALDFVSAYGTLVNTVYNSGFSLVTILVSGLIVVSVNSWQLGLFLTIIVTITIGWAYLESRTRQDLRFVRLAATKDLTGHLSDTIVNAQTVKVFAGEQKEVKKNNTLNETLRDLRVKDWVRAGKSGNNRVGTLLLMLVLLLVLINHLAKNDPAILATGIFAFTYTFTLLLRLFDINVLTRQVEESFLQATPIMQILQEDTEINDRFGAKKLNVTKGTVKLEDITFTYTDTTGSQTVFKELSLDIAAGEKIGLVGPSGGGKTTLTRLLLRFEDIQSGVITIDGQDISAVTQNSLRKAIAYVPQEPLLFHRSIRENIAYGKPTASYDEIRAAADKAYALGFIEALPNGFDTVVGERGIKLSGGQRQRVAIARAILKDAPILVLDEATSALDSESEKLIQDAFWKLMEGRTTVVVAHRLSTIQKMDRILVLEDGAITEQGSHQSLIKQKGTYARLWAHQSGGFIED